MDRVLASWRLCRTRCWNEGSCRKC
uniref:Uncharacterized protein n=1 Tax=Arundo donax TaxID=35708 RepID=A0A0A8Z8Q3_ARUDO